MRNSLTRRQFLAVSGGWLAAGGVASVAARSSRAAGTRPRLLIGCRDVHLKVTDRPDSWSAMKALGAECTEATIGEDLSFPVLFHPRHKYTAATRAGIETLAADMKGAGRRISAFCMYNHFDQRPDFELEWGAKVARAAQALGVPAIRIDVVPHKLPREKFLGFAVDVLKKLIRATESTGVRWAIENHGNTTNDPEFLKPLFARVGSKRLGLTLDTGNFYWFGHPLSKVYTLFETFAPRVFHTHCKSIHYPPIQREKQRPMGWEYTKYYCPIYQGDIDFRRVVKILRAAGYANDLCVEDETLSKLPAPERSGVVAREIRYLREIVTG
jgi:sugar phosphate isomerase/epimerase